MNSLRYIRLVKGEKRPATTFSDDNLFGYEDVEKHDDVGVIMEYPYVVIDIDDDETGKVVFDIIEDEGINSRVIKTDRGYHFWFKSEDELMSNSHMMNALGIKYDVKAWGLKKDGTPKKAQTVIKTNGVLREVIKECPLDELDEVPVFLTKVSSYMIPKYDMYNLEEGSRNSSLFSYIILLQKAGLSQLDIKYVIALINDYVLADPLDQEELENSILRDGAFISREELAMDKLVDDDGKFRHEIFSGIVRELLEVKYVNGDFYVYKDGYYQIAKNEIKAKMIELVPPLTKNMRSEVMDYMSIEAYQEHPPIEPYSVNINNGRLNMATGKLSGHHERYFDTTRVDVIYDPDAYCEITDNMIRKVMCYDEELILLFKQMLGYSLVRHNKFQKMFFLYGDTASNGKSTVLNMITEFLGQQNVTTLSIRDLNDTYKPAELQNKLANIGDDVSQLNVRESEIFKKVVTGEGIQVERKYQDSFTLRNTAKLMFSGNFLPSFSDKSEGISRRLTIIPFNAKFTPEDDDYNPHIEEDITTDLAKSYLLNIALEGYQLLEKNKGFVVPEATTKALEEFKTVTSTVMTWVSENEMTKDDFVGKLRDTLYSNYKSFCELTGVNHPVSSRSFVSEINENMGLITRQERIDGKRPIVFAEEV